MAFQTGDRVVYGMHGVCMVADEEKRTVDRKQVTYLVLEPLGQNGSRYLVPTHNAAAMAKVSGLLSREEMESLLAGALEKPAAWISDENQRKQHYRALISSGDRARLLAMICAVYRHREAQTLAGKKCHMCDDNFLRDAEKLLCSEISAVMDMEQGEAMRYMKEYLK